MSELHVWCQEPFMWEAKRLLQESGTSGVVVSLYKYEDLSCKIDGSLQILYKSKRYILPEMVIFHPANLSAKPAVRAMILELRGMAMRKAVVLNRGHLKLRSMNKLYQQARLAEGGFPYVKTMAYGGKRVLSEHKMDEPEVMKLVGGTLGKGIKEVRSIDEAIQEEDSFGRYIYQEMLKPRRDYRVIVLGDEVLGVMQRDAKEGNFVSNYSKGGSITKVELDDDTLEMVIRVVEYFSLDCVGVDLMKDMEGKWRVLELNPMAQFKGFEQATGVNVAKKMIEYMVEMGKK